MNGFMKKHLLMDFFNEKGLDFPFTMLDDSNECVYMKYNEEPQHMAISIGLTDDSYNSIYYVIGVMNNMDKREQLLDLFNSFNAEICPIKFYFDDNDNSIIAMATYIADDLFNGEEFYFYFMKFLIIILENCYDKIIEVICE